MQISPRTTHKEKCYFKGMLIIGLQWSDCNFRRKIHLFTHHIFIEYLLWLGIIPGAEDTVMRTH